MDKYTRVKLLGSGSYGTATLFTTKDGKRVVIKEIDIRSMPPSECKAAEQEAKVHLCLSQLALRPLRAQSEFRNERSLCLSGQVLLMLNHPNIVGCLESFRAQGKLCIVMDFCSEGMLLVSPPRRVWVPVMSITDAQRDGMLLEPLASASLRACYCCRRPAYCSGEEELCATARGPGAGLVGAGLPGAETRS